MEDKIYKLTEAEKNEFYTFWANYNENVWCVDFGSQHRLACVDQFSTQSLHSKNAFPVSNQAF